MKQFFFLFALILTCSLSAQTTTPTSYNLFSYAKVSPEHTDDFMQLIKAYKKIVASKKKAGMVNGWSVARVISPAGSSCAYNYIFRTNLANDDQLAYAFENDWLPANWQSLLSNEEVNVVNRRNEIRTIVKVETWAMVDQVMAADWETSKISVFNYFKSKEGKTSADHIKMENDIWKPVHAERVKNGEMKGWVLMGMQFPFGANTEYDIATVDIYKDMKQYLSPWFEKYFTKIHQGKNTDELLKKTEETTTLLSGEVRMTIDRLDWK